MPARQILSGGFARLSHSWRVCPTISPGGPARQILSGGFARLSHLAGLPDRFFLAGLHDYLTWRACPTLTSRRACPIVLLQSWRFHEKQQIYLPSKRKNTQKVPKP
jgi:hypothetical protein